MTAPERPSLTVVICNRNMRTTLGDQIRAVLGQESDRTFEVVVVDNDSIDGSQRLVEQIMQHDVRLRLVSNPIPGLNESRNVGVDAARSDYVAFCDADDLVEAGWISAMQRNLDDRVYCGGALRRAAINDEGTRYRWQANGRAVVETTRHYGRLTPPGGNCGFSKRMWSELGGFDGRLSGAGDETEFFRRAAEAGYEYRAVPEAVVAYRMPDTVRSVMRRGFHYGWQSERLVELEGLETRGFVERRWKHWIRLSVLVPVGVLRSSGRYLWLHRGARAVGESSYRVRHAASAIGSTRIHPRRST